MMNNDQNLPENDPRLQDEQNTPSTDPSLGYTDNRTQYHSDMPPHAPQFHNPPQMETEPPMRVRDWLLVLLLFCIPCVNIIVLFIWAFSDEPGKKSRSNFCKAYLIFLGISVVLSILSVIFMIALGWSLSSMMTDIRTEIHMASILRSCLPF